MKKKRISITLAITLLMQLSAITSFASSSVIDEGTTLTSKGFTFYSAQDFSSEDLASYVNVYKNGDELEGVTVTKQTKAGNANSLTGGVANIPTNNPYRVKLPEQITTSGDIYTLEIKKELTGMEEDYIKNMTLNVLLYDNFDTYTGTVATGKDNTTGASVASSEGTDEATWVGNAWTLENNPSKDYDSNAVLSIQNGQLKLDYTNSTAMSPNPVRIKSTSANTHSSWKDYTVEYDLTVLEVARHFTGGVYPRANEYGNNKSPNLWRKQSSAATTTNFLLFGSYLRVDKLTNDIPAVNTPVHVEATAVGGTNTTTDPGSYTLVIDDKLICNVTNYTTASSNQVTATGTPYFGATADQDFCMDNLVVSKAFDVVDFNVANSGSYPAGNEIILDAPCAVDSDTLDTSDFSVYTGTGSDKVEMSVSGVASVDSDSVKLTLEQNMKNKVSYTVDVVGDLKSGGKEVVFRGVSFTVEPNEIDVENITKDGNIYTAILKNYRASETTVFATLAAYDEYNKLIGISGGSYTLANDTAEESRKITLTVADASYVKCYILNGLTNINTIAEEQFLAE